MYLDSGQISYNLNTTGASTAEFYAKFTGGKEITGPSAPLASLPLMPAINTLHFNPGMAPS